MRDTLTTRPVGSLRGLAIAAGLFTVAVSAVAAFLSRRYYYADTPFFLVRQLESAWFFSNDPPRVLAQWLLQVPLQAALAAGITSVPVLGGLYGATLYGAPLLLLLLCYHYSEKKRLFLFPLASYLLATLPAYSFIISEAHLTAGAFWLCAVLINRSTPLSDGQWLLLLVTAVLCSRSYESAAILLPLLVVLLAWRGKLRLTGQALPWWLLAAVFLVGAAMAGQGIVEPRDSVNRGRFLQSLAQILTDSFYLHAVALWMLALGVMRYFRRLPGATVQLAAGCLLSVILLVVFATAPALLGLDLAYPSRVLLLVVPALLLCLWMVAQATAGPASERVTTALAALCIVCASYQLAAQLHASYQWHGYRKVYQRTLEAAGPRIVEFRDTALGREYEGRVALRAQHWRWTLPLLNIVFAQHAVVPRYLYDLRAGYQPYNLHNLPALDRYGIGYAFSNRVEPGESLPFKHAKLDFHRWYRPGKKFRWAVGSNADIRFLVADPGLFSGTASVTLGVRDPQQVEIWLNNMRLFEGRLEQPRQSLDLAFNPLLLHGDRENTLSFWFSDPRRGSDRDARLLAGKFHSLVLHAAQATPRH